MSLTIQQAIARVPFLENLPDLKVSALSGGITNLNYRIDTGETSYVIRITGENTALLGIKRDVEHAANSSAGALGISPEVCFFIEPEGYLVTRFVNGKHIPPAEITKPHNIRRVARKLRLFHRNAPPLNGEFNVFRRVDMLTKVSRANNSKFPFDFDWIMAKAHEAEHALLNEPYSPAPCHDDLLNLNFMDEDVPGEIGELRLLDWEYAGMGDVFFDLGNFCHHHRLDDEQAQILLQEYYGEVTPKHFARLKLMIPMSELHEALWGTTQSRISTLNEDFQGHADLWFGRMRMDASDYKWDEWLRTFKSTGLMH